VEKLKIIMFQNGGWQYIAVAKGDEAHLDRPAYVGLIASTAIQEG